MYYLGIDLGGTNIAAGIVNEQYQIIARAKRPTRVNCGDEAMTEQLALAALEALGAAGLAVEDVPWIGVGSPGSIDSKNGVVCFAGNLGLREYQMAKLLGERLRAKVIVENDANAAAFGEYKAGALKGADNGIAVTLGTGIGGGIILNGKIYTGCNGAAGELGHIVIEMDGRPCTCGRHGCWEAYASATGLILTTKEAMQDADKSSPIWQICGGDLDKVDGRTAFDAMRAGDPVGKQVVDTYIKHLGTGLADVINILQPSTICIGGGISHEGETLLAPLRAFVRQEAFEVPGGMLPEIRAAELGNDAGIIGAALLGEA